MLTAILIFIANAVTIGSQQGVLCKTSKECAAPLTCEKTSGAPKCERLCDVKNVCPSDERCVKDHNIAVCRPINDQDQ